jgi:gamma-glutamylcyclotransferase (GGCT)/AIG2-like uncharacterized protein YtfP
MPTPVLLFSYGTLQKTGVQRATFGRDVQGRKDALPGYRLAQVPITDPNLRKASGLTHNANAVASSNPDDVVEGMVLEITQQELLAADGYEAPAEYRRIQVRLRSGDMAWVYVHQPRH